MALPQVFQTIAGAKTFGRADRFKDGRGVLTVRNVLQFRGQKGDQFVMEFKLESVEAKDGKPANTVGATVGQALNLTTNQSAPGNAKAFVLALMGADDDPNLGETIQELVNTDPIALGVNGKPMQVQPARGMRVGFETYHTQTKAGGDFMGINFFTINDNAPAKVAERRAALGLDKAAAPAQPAPRF